ncbi:MAG: ABC transporter ATP-binding protein [Tissierellia bacterium]|nr:ABC transporter ATP-binding protein [Tissierellia bacterium]
MINYLKNRYALTKEGATQLLKGIISHSLLNISLVLPIGLSMYFIQNVLMKNDAGNMKKYILISIAMFIVTYIFAYIDYYQTFTTIYTESAKRRISLAEKLKLLPLSFFDRKDVSDLSATIMSDTNEMEQLFSHAVPQMYAAIINFIILSIILLIYNWKMALSAIWIIPVAFLIFRLSKNMQQRLSKEIYLDRRNIAEKVQSGLDNIQEIYSYNMQNEYTKDLNKSLDDYEKTLVRSEAILGAFVNLSHGLLKLGIPSVTLYGAHQFISGNIDILTYIGFIILAVRIYDPIMEIINNFAALNFLDVRIDRMKEMDALPVQEGSKEFEPNGYDIVFENVSFSYKENLETIKNISFSANQGEVTALVGPSGGGKTTVTKLAGRFWDINSGKITVGGVDISKIDPEELLKSYSIVFQEVALFNSTVMENIRLGKKGATDEEVLQAAKIANCDEFVKKLPNGYETDIGENGEKLSGGERQRISIARAILKDAPIILLDEATASIDVENESKIQEALSNLIKDKTVLIIAHRMRTIAGVDKVIVLDNGEIVESGSPKELKERGQIFASMLKRQSQ